MDNQDRTKLGQIDETLRTLRAWWDDPSQKRTAFDKRSVSVADETSHRDNLALHAELKELEAERSRIHSLVMGGQAPAEGELDLLVTRTDRLRIGFSALMT